MKEFKLGITMVVAIFLATLASDISLLKYNKIKYGETLQVLENLPDFSVKKSDFARNTYTPMVRLEEEKTKDNPGGFVCSGTVISNEYVLTAAHCLVDDTGNLKKTIKIVNASIPGQIQFSSTQDATPVAVNQRSDIGLVKGSFEMYQKMPIFDSPALPMVLTMENNHVCGFAWGDTRPVCYAANLMGQFRFQLYGESALFPGMSGGPVLNHNLNAIVAVNTGVYNDKIIVSPLIGMFNYFNIKVVQEEVVEDTTQESEE